LKNITNNQNNYPDRMHFMPYISKNIADSVLSIKWLYYYWL